MMFGLYLLQILLCVLLFSHENNATLCRRHSFCQACDTTNFLPCQNSENRPCEGSGLQESVDPEITTTLAAPLKNDINIAFRNLNSSIAEKLSTLRETHLSLPSECSEGSSYLDVSPIQSQANMENYMKVLFKKITTLALHSEYAYCQTDNPRSGDYEAIRRYIDVVLCAFLRRDQNIQHRRNLCSPKFCPRPVQGRTKSIEFEICTLQDSSTIMNGLISSWTACIDEENETYLCQRSSRRSRRHNRGNKKGRKHRRKERRLRRKNKLRKGRIPKRCLKKNGKAKKRCIRRWNRKVKKNIKA